MVDIRRSQVYVGQVLSGHIVFGRVLFGQLSVRRLSFQVLVNHLEGLKLEWSLQDNAKSRYS